MKKILYVFIGICFLLPCKAEQKSANGIWLFSRDMNDVSLNELAAKDIGHIFLNEVAFKFHGQDSTIAFIKAAKEKNILVHIWCQVFYDEDGWVSPVDDTNNCYRQELFDKVIKRAEKFVDQGVEGIHLDYLRFGGTAHRHNPSDSITATGAITEFCRQINHSLKAKNPNVILSAAMMPEIESQTLYGQDPGQMGQYMDILVPMIFRYAPDFYILGPEWPLKSAEYFTANGTPAQIWVGTTTYNRSIAPLSEKKILSDCRELLKSNATGVVLFRYGIGKLPDFHKL